MNDVTLHQLVDSLTNSRNESRAVGLFAQAEMAKINIAILRQLRQAGWRTYLYVIGEESVRSHQRYVDDGTLTGIVRANQFYDALKGPLPDARTIVERALEYERKTGCSFGSLWMARRELGLGYALGGINHMSSPASANADRLRALHAETEFLAFWEQEITSKGIVLMLGAPKAAAVMCRALGIQYRFLYATRYENFYYWACDEFLEYPSLKAAYDAVASEDDDFALTGQYLQDIESRKRFAGPTPYRRMMKLLFDLTKRRLYLRLKGYEVGNEYYVSDMFRYYWRYARLMRNFRTASLPKLSDLENLRFVYYPLQTEPEYSLTVASPEYFFQLEAIASISRDLPADTVLVVKETVYALGRRPADFYKTIQSLKNVVLMDIDEPGWRVASAASAVATITGTGGLEAAISGVPVILFGRHNGYDFLEHVFSVRCAEDLRPALLKALSPSFDRVAARRNGRRLAKALQCISFDMRGFNTVDLNSYDDAIVTQACRALLMSLPSESSNGTIL